MMRVLYFLSLVLGVFSGANFTYDRCDKTWGPLYWGATSAWATCGTVSSPQAQGTPIDVCGAVSFPGGAPTFSVSGYDTARRLNASNLGYTVQIYIGSDPPTLTLGNISAIVGRGSNASTHTWAMLQVHLHWGRTDKTGEGSEHYLQGTAYPIEAHLVHYNTRYGSAAAALASGAADALLVVGVFLQIGSTDLDVMSVLASATSGLKQSQTTLSSDVKMSDLFSGTGSYYSYAGSLTTPPCSEIVTWVVMKDVKSITTSTLNKFKQASTSPAASRKFEMQESGSTQGVYGNFRPLQPRNSRTVYTSDGTTTSCTTVTEQYGTCPTTSGALQFGPSVVFHLIALFIAVSASRI